MPPLTHDAHFKEHGVGEMLTKDAFYAAWTEYQGYTLYRLNKLVSGTYMQMSTICARPSIPEQLVLHAIKVNFSTREAMGESETSTTRPPIRPPSKHGLHLQSRLHGPQQSHVLQVPHPCQTASKPQLRPPIRN